MQRFQWQVATSRCGVFRWQVSFLSLPAVFLNFGGHQSFCGTTDSPVLDFWSALGFKAKMDPMESLYSPLVLHLLFVGLSSQCETRQMLYRLSDVVVDFKFIHYCMLKIQMSLRPSNVNSYINAYSYFEINVLVIYILQNITSHRLQLYNFSQSFLISGKKSKLSESLEMKCR